MSNSSSSSNHPHQDSRDCPYQVIRELEGNTERGQVFYLAKDNATGKPVFITRFIFSQSGINPSDLEFYQKKINELKRLSHPGIPRYLDLFKTTDSFYLVQEYKDAQSLDVSHEFTAQEIKQIAVSILEILVYLHNSSFSVIHGNIKPENVLLDNQLNVSLINGGLATERRKVGLNGKVGTCGFQAPEQLLHRQPTPPTDLYYLGVTLICWLTHTPSSEIHRLIDKQDRIKFQHLVPTWLSLGFINWLDTMVQPNRQERYPNAIAALDALKAIEVTRLPNLKINLPSLEFKATHLGEKLTQAIAVSNPIPDTVLKGIWKVALHPHDPLSRPTSHAWISFDPAKFEGNQVECKITLDTSKLRSNQVYKRRIVLHSNALPKTHTLTVHVQTAALETHQLPYLSFLLLFAIAALGGWLQAWAIGEFSLLGWGFLSVGLALGCVNGWALMVSATELFFSTSLITLSIGMAFALFCGIGAIEVGLVGYSVGIFVGLLVAALAANVVKQQRKRKFPSIFAMSLSILTAALGMSLGIGFRLGFLHLFLSFAGAGMSLPLVIMLLYPPLKQFIRIFRYRRAERYLIKP
ncbi:protein kinase domain-containing protein [Allocoleopsis sp.]|uniref:protein kinase domain-containing protein n=1 Tax=Allocoleopsis sp. TaxID=3088169 RepID=UPI002FD4C2CA